MNKMTINNVAAVIEYDSDIEMFRGEFVGLNGGADFYGSDVVSLKSEGHRSLEEFLVMCEERNITPYKNYSGKFNIRIDPELHEKAVVFASTHKESLNSLVARSIERAITEEAIGY